MITSFLQIGLFLWFILSLFLVAHDKTVSFELMCIMEVVNILCLGYIGANIFKQNSGILYFTIGVILLAWYIYFTPQDFHNMGYGRIEKFTYLAIDLAMIVYLSSSMLISLSAKFVNYYSLNLQDRLNFVG
jgi:hypothetical protein